MEGSFHRPKPVDIRSNVATYPHEELLIHRNTILFIVCSLYENLYQCMMVGSNLNARQITSNSPSERNGIECFEGDIMPLQAPVDGGC